MSGCNLQTCGRQSFHHYFPRNLKCILVTFHTRMAAPRIWYLQCYNTLHYLAFCLTLAFTEPTGQE